MKRSSWLDRLADSVSAILTPLNSSLLLGCHSCEVDGVWEVSLFPGSTEVWGGRNDGRRIHPGFVLDILTLLSLFENVQDLTWQSRAFDRQDELRAHVRLEGSYEGHPIRLQILAKAPPNFGPVGALDAQGNFRAEFW